MRIHAVGAPRHVQVPAWLACFPDLSDPLRLFTAILPTAREREAVAALRRSWVPPGQRLCPRAERLHMTLQFVAQWPADRVAEWQQALSSLQFAPFDLVLDRCELWPGQLLVLRPCPSTPLRALHAATRELAEQVGLPLQARRWRPHVTVLHRAALPQVPSVARSLTWRVDAVCLVQSDLAAQPPSYTVVGRYPGDR